MQQPLVFTNPYPGGVTGVRLFFVASRTLIFASRVSGLPADTSVSVQVGDNGLDVHWTKELAPGSDILITLEIQGEPLVISRTLWFQGKALLVEGQYDRDGWTAAAPDAFTDPGAYALAKFRERCAAVTTHADPTVRKNGAFFCDLDVNTNPDLMKGAGLDPKVLDDRLRRVMAAETQVYARIIRRRNHAPSGDCKGPKELPKIPHLREISEVMLTIYQRHLTANGVLDADQVWTAFEMFANGELRVPASSKKVWNGEPNGAMAFGFAEFAFEAYDEGIDRDEWCLILPSHVAMQQIYVTAYSPPEGAELRFGAYRPENFHENKQVDCDMKKKLRAHFSKMSVEELKLAAATHLCRALPTKP